MDFLTMRDISKSEIEKILESAKSINEGEKIDLSGKILGTLFFESSTRTKLSFHSAAYRSKMNVIDFQTEISSMKKGESFSDTIQMLSGYCDVLAIRHFKEGAPAQAAQISNLPVINAGDGTNQHPSQTMIDLFSIKHFKGRIKGVNVTLMGDLLHARAMKSLVAGLSLFGANITLCAPKGLEFDQEYLSQLTKQNKTKFTFVESPDLSLTDVLYLCRIQKERFADSLLANQYEEKFRVDSKLLEKANEDLIILHPLPRLGELDVSVDKTEFAKYFDQARFAVPVRQAVLKHVLEVN